MANFFDFNKLNNAVGQYDVSKSDGRRARLRPKPAALSEILQGDILKPLLQTYGMVWPYQPQISYTQQVDYQQVPLVHTNQDFYAYTRSPTPELTVEGDFTVQNQTEGVYALASIHFLRVVTKMYFGSGQHLGTPPPVLFFDAYGDYMFNKLPVIVTQFTANMIKDVDYVAIDVSNIGKSNPIEINSWPGLSQSQNYVWLPSVFNISVTLKIQNTPARLKQFDLDAFRKGDLLKSGGWL